MKVYAVMICWNSEPYIKFAIKSILPFVDKLIIVCGAQAEFRDIKHDDTKRIVLKEQRKDDKITVLLNNFDDEAQQRNYYLKHIHEMIDKPDWLWIVDSDEFYTPQHAFILLNVANRLKQSDMRAIIYPFRNFYGEMPHGFNYYKMNNTGMLKFIKWNENLVYHYREPQLLDNIGTDKLTTLWEDKTFLYHTVDVECFHYGHVWSREQYTEKLLGSCLRDKHNPKKAHLSSLSKEKQIEWIHGNYPWFHDGWRKKMNLDVFQGQHPLEIMKMRLENDIG